MGRVRDNVGGHAVRLLVVAIVAAVVTGCGSHSAQPTAIVAHAPSPFADSPVEVDIRGLAPGEAVVLHASWASVRGGAWTSSVPLRAGRSGSIRLRGVSGMRFLWSMRPTDPGSVICCFGAPIAGRNAVTLSVTSGGRQLARTSLSRRITPASVRVRYLTVAHDRIYGYEFTPAGGARRPGVLVIGGSEGGDGVGVVEAAGLLAAHGYPTLALAYFKEPGLPSALARIPLEYFARALRVLRRQPDVDTAHLVVMGSSRGGEAALLIASTFPTVVHGAIALVPNVNIGPSPARSAIPAWTYRGQALAPGTPIPLGRIDGPIMAVGGGLDNVWDSPTYVQEIQQRLRDSHSRFDDTTLVYPQAGHNIGVPVPYLPQPIEQSFFGGTAGGDAAAKADLWPRILRYLSQLTQSMPKG